MPNDIYMNQIQVIIPEDNMSYTRVCPTISPYITLKLYIGFRTYYRLKLSYYTATLSKLLLLRIKQSKGRSLDKLGKEELDDIISSRGHHTKHYQTSTTCCLSSSYNGLAPPLSHYYMCYRIITTNKAE